MGIVKTDNINTHHYWTCYFGFHSEWWGGFEEDPRTFWCNPYKVCAHCGTSIREKIALTSNTGDDTKLKALFAIKEVSTDRIIPEPMFEDKQLAKDMRRKLNGASEGKENFQYVVTYGPDHDRFEPDNLKLKESKDGTVARASRSRRRRERSAEEDAGRDVAGDGQTRVLQGA